jgi:hypothetical protein
MIGTNIGGTNIEVQKSVFNDSQMTDMNSLSNAFLSNPTQLSPVITHLAGKESMRFPLSFLSEGLGNGKAIERLEYEYRVQTRRMMTRPIAITNGGASIGQGGSTFELIFPDSFFINQYVLVNGAGEQARIMKQPKEVSGGGGWKYTMRLVNPASAAVLSTGFSSGDLWAPLFAPVGVDFSTGNASNWQAPGKVRNKLTTVRKSYHMSGNAKDFVAEFTLPTKGGKTTKLWMDYEEYQHMLAFKEECEMYYWYGERTYGSDGVVNMVDENDQPVVIGPGLLEQIINQETYSTLTENHLKNIIGDLFYGMTDAHKKQITLYTGTGGMREFDEALKNHFGGAAQSWQVSGESRFITGSGRNLGLTGYFKNYEHVDGHTVTVAKMPMFDEGPMADVRDKHPVTGFSLESYRMVFVDQSTYDGANNLQMITKKGREHLRWCTAGSIVPRGFSQDGTRASDVDGASVHMLKTGGISLRRFDTSLDLQCIAS